MEKILIPTNGIKLAIVKEHDGKTGILVDNTNDVSDGYHTFGELYEHRVTLFIALCRIMSETSTRSIWRSQLHSDGSSFDGWFILGMGREPGRQITYHLPMSKWSETEFATTVPMSPEFDGHSPVDVLARLRML